MRYAFLILAHTDPNQLRRLIHALDDDRFDFYVHIDRKSDLSSFEFESYGLKHSRLTVLEKRYRLYWGDISIVQAMIALYRKAFENGDYARFITLSGMDYPIRSNDEIFDALSDLSVEHIHAVQLPEEMAYRLRFICLWKFGPLATRCSMGLSRRNLLRHPVKLKLGGKKVPVYFASQWHALSRNCVEHILRALDQNRGIIRFFRFSYAPDELLIPTLVCNSSFQTAILPEQFPEEYDFETLFHRLPAIHYLWQKGWNLTVFSEADYDELHTSGKLFFRKARTGISDKLLDRIDETRNYEVET